MVLLVYLNSIPRRRKLVESADFNFHSDFSIDYQTTVNLTPYKRSTFNIFRQSLEIMAGLENPEPVCLGIWPKNPHICPDLRVTVALTGGCLSSSQISFCTGTHRVALDDWSSIWVRSSRSRKNRPMNRRARRSMRCASGCCRPQARRRNWPG